MARPKNFLNNKENLIKEINSMLKELKAEEKEFNDSGQKVIYRILYYKHLFTNRPYTSSKFGYWVKKFSEFVPEIREGIEKIKEIIEARIVYCASRNKINPGFAMFWLKNNASWRDVQETKGEVKHEHNVNMPPAAKSMAEWEKGIKKIYEEREE